MANNSKAAAKAAPVIVPLSGTTNEEFFQLARTQNPHFESVTQNLTYRQLKDGYNGQSGMYDDIVNEWFQISGMIRLQKISVADFKRIPAIDRITETYENYFAAVSQRLYIYPIENLDPAWMGEDGKGLKDGDTVDPWIVMKGKMTQFFWKTNFNYQGGTTLQEFQRRQILASEYGMDEISGGYIRQLYVAWGKQEQLAVLDCLNAAINNADFPLAPTQKLEVASWTDTNGYDSVTPEEFTQLLVQIDDIAMDIDGSISTGAYNAMGYDTAVDNGNMVVLMRPQIKNRITKLVEAGTFNDDKLNLIYDVEWIKNFGGLIPTNKEGNLLYPVRSGKLKRLIGWATEAVATEPTVTDKNEIVWVDPNERVLAVIIQKGAIFRTDQNGIRLRNTGINPRGEYENFFFNVINAGIHYDPHYNIVVVCKPAAASAESQAYDKKIAEYNAAQIKGIRDTKSEVVG